MSQELYALGSNRSASFALSFLDHFAPNRKPCTEDYPIPESADEPAAIFETDGEILDYLETNREESYGLYWKDLDSDAYEQVMLFYTNDGMVIFGLACEESKVNRRIQELKAFVHADYTLKGWEQRPPESSDAFIKLSQSSGQ